MAGWRGWSWLWRNRGVMAGYTNVKMANTGQWLINGCNENQAVMALSAT